MEKVVVAYSGGLDTSYCVKYLIHEKKLEVHTILVNTGGFSDEELIQTEKRAYELGSSSHVNKTILNEFYQKAIKYLIFGNVLKNNTYPLSVSAERIFQAIEVINYAKKVGAKYIAHGSTGAGNDQIRFDMIFQTLAPEIEIITPIRDLKLSRQEEVEFLKKHQVHYSWEKAQYSINKGIWGTSVGGKETLTSKNALPEDAYPSQLKKETEETITLNFEKGELIGLDGIKDEPVKNIQKLEELASAFAIGRDIHVGDTIIGIKGRVGFEAAAPLVIIKAHHLLEKHVLTKWQQYWKEQLANWYGMLLHEGNYLDPVMRNIEVFLDDSQKSVTGDVIVKLKPYHFTLEGIESEFDMMKSDFGQYGEMNNSWTSDDAKGFIKIYGNANKIYHNVNPSES
ncbi:argininosuccinate synthase [Aquimarina sp. MMG015]|uniref:argininosuccinate synthase n=1 Tax=unclassified Aquimarina TaxID=2627091 RepID=UPI000E52EB2E|nr:MULTISPECIES: argininosuccinate synthase domain-containing protein [unclassified Aquimarina]AXT54401.1 argininosuccinate synthase [Aquimarina sp. AD1]MBQ4804059.1 argininosuccinate synthase [Aquimarina sp. MMG015]RKN28979.1 argininosuccinate synthase [Aquimarina sp. AD1]